MDDSSWGYILKPYPNTSADTNVGFWFAALTQPNLGCRVCGPSPDGKDQFSSLQWWAGVFSKTCLHFPSPSLSWCPTTSRLLTVSLLSNYGLGFSNFTESDKRRVNLGVAPDPQLSQWRGAGWIQHGERLNIKSALSLAGNGHRGILKYCVSRQFWQKAFNRLKGCSTWFIIKGINVKAMIR